jgi:hypothetical protein
VTSAGSPNQAAPVPWQLAQLTADTAAWPAAARFGTVVILKPPAANPLLAWQVLHAPVPMAMWLAAPEVPIDPGGPTADTPSHVTLPEVLPAW